MLFPRCLGIMLIIFYSYPTESFAFIFTQYHYQIIFLAAKASRLQILITENLININGQHDRIPNESSPYCEGNNVTSIPLRICGKGNVQIFEKCPINKNIFRSLSLSQLIFILGFTFLPLLIDVISSILFFHIINLMHVHYLYIYVQVHMRTLCTVQSWKLFEIFIRTDVWQSQTSNHRLFNFFLNSHFTFFLLQECFSPFYSNSFSC